LEGEKVKKPIHPVALAMFVIAALYFFLAPLFVMASRMSIPQLAVLWSWSLWALGMLGSLPSCAELVGIGALVELVDRIRWNALPPEKQVPRRPLYKSFRHLKGWNE
jgi:hypothetical protein